MCNAPNLNTILYSEYFYEALYLYYKRGDPYRCSAKAPVVEGSGSRRLYRRKGRSVDRVYVVFGARVYLGFLTIRQKRIRGGSTYDECNSGPLKQHNATGATPPMSHCHAWRARGGCGRERGIDGREGGCDDARQGESVSGGRGGVEGGWVD